MDEEGVENSKEGKEVTGCRIRSIVSSAVVQRASFSEALSALQAVVQAVPGIPLAWVDAGALAGAQGLSGALDAWGWTWKYVWNGIKLGRPDRDRWGDDELMLEALSKWMAPGSEIVVFLENTTTQKISFSEKIIFTRKGLMFRNYENDFKIYRGSRNRNNWRRKSCHKTQTF